jgi:[acyl-carrier-protein] S-malonyltransferase
MGKDLAAAHSRARDVFERVDAALGQPLSALCFEGPADQLTLTHNAQPALLTHGAAVWAVVRDAVGKRVQAAAGHSLGEYTAYQAVGTLGLEDAAKLVRTRGELMYQAGQARPGAMAAVLGELSQPIETICEQASKEGEVVVPANYNTQEQVVISGEIAAVERAMELAKAAGAKRAVKLNVSGAFHSPLMAPASLGLRSALYKTKFTDPGAPVFANVNAEPTTNAADARERIAQQLTAPVRWTQVMQNLAAAFPDALFVEMGPGNVLAGLARRIAPNVATATCGTAAEVDALMTKLAA